MESCENKTKNCGFIRVSHHGLVEWSRPTLLKLSVGVIEFIKYCSGKIFVVSTMCLEIEQTRITDYNTSGRGGGQQKCQGGNNIVTTL